MQLLVRIQIVQGGELSPTESTLTQEEHDSGIILSPFKIYLLQNLSFLGGSPCASLTCTQKRKTSYSLQHHTEKQKRNHYAT